MACHHHPSNNFSHQMTTTIMQQVINVTKISVVANTFWDSECKQMDISTQFVLQIKTLVEGSLRLIYNSDSHIKSCYNFGHSSFSAVNITLESAGKIAIQVSQKSAKLYDNKWKLCLQYETSVGTPAVSKKYFTFDVLAIGCVLWELLRLFTNPVKTPRCIYIYICVCVCVPT